MEEELLESDVKLRSDDGDGNDDEMETTVDPFQALLDQLTKNRTRDPRSVRLAAVTAAILDLTRENSDGQPKELATAAQVYAKAVTALERTLSASLDDEAALAQSVSTQVALLDLLTQTLPHVSSPPLLVATLPLSSRVLRALVASTHVVEGSSASNTLLRETKDELGGVNALLRGVARCTAALVAGLPPSADYQTVRPLVRETLVRLADDRRPKVRKAAQAALVESLAAHPPIVAPLLQDHFHKALVHARTHHLDLLANESEPASLVHLLALLERCIRRLPSSSQLSTDVMELFTALVQADATAAVSDFVAMGKTKDGTPRIILLQALMTVVLATLQEDDEGDDMPSSTDNAGVDSHMASRVLATFLTCKPALLFRSGTAKAEMLEAASATYGQVVIACTRVVLEAPEHHELACKMMPLAVQMILLLAKPPTPEDVAVANTLMADLTHMWRQSLPSFVAAQPASLAKCQRDALECFRAVLGQPAYRPCWSAALPCWVALVHQFVDSDAVPPAVEEFLQLRNKLKANSTLQRTVEDALSTLVQVLGIERVWGWLALESTSAIPRDRAWVLVTLKTAAMAAQPGQPRLGFFQETILGLARQVDKWAATDTKEPAFYRARVLDLWSLLPCFCQKPVDVEAYLPGLAQTLGKALEDSRYPKLVAIISRSIAVLCESFRESDNSEGETVALELAATKLLPVMFKIVTSSRLIVGSNKNGMDVDDDDKTVSFESNSESGQQVHFLSVGIAALGRFAATNFLQGLFKKLMQRLLAEIQSEERDTEKICAYLSLSQALVSSGVLDEASLSFLYRALKPFLRTDEFGPRCQKKAYKALADMCQRHPSFFADMERLKEMTALFEDSTATSQIAARHMRMRCLNLIVNGLQIEREDLLVEVKNVVAETVLCLKDSNGKTREAAFELLTSLAGKGDISRFVQRVTALLGAETTHMRSAAVMALSRIVFEFAWDNRELQALLPSLLKTMLVLIKESSREVVKGVVGFVRVSVAAIPPAQLEPLLPELLPGLLDFHKVKDRFRAKIKIILKRLVKAFGYDALMPFVPASETRLLTHMRKLEERQKRRKETLKSERREERDFDEMIESDEDNSDDGRTLFTGVTGLTKTLAPSRKTAKSVGTRTRGDMVSKASTIATNKSKRKLVSFGGQISNEADGDVVDMLGSKFAKQAQADDIDDADSLSSAGVMEFDEDGKLVIMEEPTTRVSEPEERFEHRRNKRRRTGLESSSKSGNTKRSKSLGEAFKSKRADGDVRKKEHKYEPFAFVPLDGRSYSKKNRRSAVDQMASVVRQRGKRKNGGRSKSN